MYVDSCLVGEKITFSLMDWDSSDANDNKHGYCLACPLFSKFLGLKQDFSPNNGAILTHDH